VKCPKCQKESPSGADYCVWCGSRLAASLNGRGQPLSETDGLPEIKEHLNEMAVRLSKVEGRVTRISERVNLETVQPQAEISATEVIPQGEWPGEVSVKSIRAEVVGPEVLPPRPMIEPITTQETRRSELPAEVRGEGPSTGRMVSAKPALDALKTAEPPRFEHCPERPTETPSVSAWPPQSPPKPPQPSRLAKRPSDWEQALPGNWLSRIGIVALFIGLGFLAKLAYDGGWLIPELQLLVGLACGGLLLLAGHHWRERYHAWAQALTGGGIAVLYLSIFASYALNDLWSFLPTFGCMFMVTILAVGIALRRDSMSIAIIGIVGAFLVPITLGALDQSVGGAGSGGNNTGLLIAYVLTLDVAVVWLASVRNWRWFTLLGFGGSMAIFGLWYCTSDPDGLLGPAQGMLTGIFICFAAATTLFHVVWRRTPEPTDLALMSLNAGIYFCVSYGLLWGEYRGWLGLFSLLLASFFGVLGYLALRRSEDNRRLADFAFGISIVLLTIAIPVQLHRSHASWITMAWAAEGAVVIWISVRQCLPKLQPWGLGALAMAVVGLLAFNGITEQERFRPFMNDTLWALAISILAFYAGAYLLRRTERALQPWFFAVMMLVGCFFTIWLFSAEVVSYAGSRIMAARMDGLSFVHIRNLENGRSLALVSLWGTCALCLLMVGIRKNWDWLRMGAYMLMAVASAATVVLLNHSHAMIRSGTSHPVINYSFGGFCICVGALYVLAYAMARNRSRLLDAERRFLSVIIVGANVLSLFALSSEVLTYVDSEYGKSMGLTLLWATYGLALVVVGIMGKSRWVRLGGLALVSVAILKLFIWDTFHLQSGYRVAAYLILGVLLLAGGYFYHRYANVIKGFIMDRPGKGSGSAHD
jgi:uncharacterized membrane protein